MTAFVKPAWQASDEQFIGRNSAGKYHRAWGATTNCNFSGQRRSIICRPASIEDCNKAAPEMFCKKCFVAKPEAFATFNR